MHLVNRYTLKMRLSWKLFFLAYTSSITTRENSSEGSLCLFEIGLRFLNLKHLKFCQVLYFYTSINLIILPTIYLPKWTFRIQLSPNWRINVGICSLYMYMRSQRRYMDRVKRIWYLSPMRAAKVQASLRTRAFSPEPPLLAHTSSESRATFRQKARSLPPLNGWACAVKICHDGMLEDTNSLDGAHMLRCFEITYNLPFAVLACQFLYFVLHFYKFTFYYT